MESFRCSCVCLFGGILLSIILGIIIGILQYLGFLPLVTIGVWIAFGIAVLALILLWVSIISSSNRPCLRMGIGVLLTGIIGAIVTALAALSTVLVSYNVIIAILVGLVILFLGLTLSALTCIILCALNPGGLLGRSVTIGIKDCDAKGNN